MRRLDADLAAAKQRAQQLEGSVRAKDKDLDALQRQLNAAKVGGRRCGTGGAAAVRATRVPACATRKARPHQKPLHLHQKLSLHVCALRAHHKLAVVSCAAAALER